MNPLVTPDQSEFTPLTLICLEECSDDSVYAPGYIQPHGVLLTLQAPDLKIIQASENVEQFFGVPAIALLGQPLQRLFSRSQVKRVAALVQQSFLEGENLLELTARVKVQSPPSLVNNHQQSVTASQPGTSGTKVQTFRSILHKTADALILELEPQRAIEKIHSIRFYHRLQTAILRLRNTNDLDELAHTLAREVKAITGFDRVMVYRFETDGHGVVIAEQKEHHLESYLGLHYPATDVPAPSRQLFAHHWVRVIPDINAMPAHLIPTLHPGTNAPLNLGECDLRGVHPSHIEYMQNMGVAGSMTISLIDDRQLWGLIACHHYSPRLVDYETRKICEFLGQFASIELVHQQDRELDHYQIQAQAFQAKLRQAFLREPNFMEPVLTHNATELMDLVHASGVAIALDRHISLIGQTPPLPAVQALLAWLSQTQQSEVYVTTCLSQVYPPAHQWHAIASGILVIAIVLQQESYHLIWFRPEQVQTVHWAGNPRDSMTVDELGRMRLCPRKSFELWKETVQATSLPWHTAEIEAARMMRNILLVAVLEFSQAELEQAAERAAIANRAKSQFLAKMSHELRTPLNAILGFTQLMNRNPQTPAEFQEHLGIISRSGEHLLVLINDVLEMSKIEAGQVILTERSFHLHRLLRSLQEMFILKAAQKGLTLTFEQSPNLPCYVYGDEAKLRQILINLIGNAIKFTTQGSVTVQASATSTITENRDRECTADSASFCHTLMLSLVVKDTGCGIECGHWESIFEAFMQTNPCRHVEGTGLGLSISRQFARLMGGDITVHSEVNQGSTFTCQVMLHQPEMVDVVESSPLQPVIGLEPGQPTYRILVVEDVLENRQLLKALLEPIGFAVQTVENGEMAIAQWQIWQPHLILMDIQMPIMDGYTATQQIRQAEQHNHGDTKIIALTAYAFETDRDNCLQAGCNDYIAKPFTEASLFDAIARQLGVRYRYAESTLPEPTPLEHPSLTAADFQIMPATWIAQVHAAALDLNDYKIRRLITQIPPEAQAFMQAMTNLVENFQLEAIANLTEPR